MSAFSIATLVGWAVVVVLAAVFRNRFFAGFVGVLVGVECLIAVGLAPHVGLGLPIFCAFQATVFLHFASLSRPRMRPAIFRWFLSWPGLFFAAGTLLALPWAVAAAFGLTPWGWPLAYAVAAVGLVQSLTSRLEEVELRLDGADAGPLARHRPGPVQEARTLRIAQITDPHLGPLMSVARLRGICERAVAAEPDLVTLTGDFLTMESQSDPEVLRRSLEPLSAMEGRVFACLGNHDLEAPALVRTVLKDLGIPLLVDEEVLLETPAGPVQLVGADFRFRGRKAHLEELTESCPPKPGHLRVIMLHDPGAFRHLPPGTADLVLAGHTHGGQVGFLSLGLRSTLVSLFTSIPDHGLWARGKDRLYVHRGTGVYGFPVRVGVPGEESVLTVHVAPGAIGASR